ncbi:hypothetical protein [Micromonospora sagamiensis]|uniref:Uncharacterized protein n=1 Tax=Micromonospora sagamiensis TaxID=47875 RepID=A0A562WQ47_9ACTN|nr:hypothetical protein [Micromonospora sagamiensis]TWJ32338.1 hypothetical protein JD81_05913 [Micromonospora sagamiensis]BCL14598.1 hypothetical protein GCM10017556_23370 [Micromonospora sagamiensis]
MTTTIRTPTTAAPATTASATAPAIEVDDRRSITLVPVSHRNRTVGAYIVRDGTARFHPVVDVTRIVAWSLAATAVTTAAVAMAITRRRPSAIGTVTMGHGGWVSLKNQPAPALHAAARGRPWWAHLLRARRLVPER